MNGIEEVQLTQCVLPENSDVLMKVIVGILCAIAIYVIITIIIGYNNKKYVYKMNNSLV